MPAASALDLYADSIGVKIRQYAYLSLRSRRFSAIELTDVIGMAPDSILVKGARHTTPREVPVSHMWAIECRSPGLTVSEQITEVINRVTPVAAELRSAAALQDVSATMIVVRYLNDSHGEEELFEAGIDPDGMLYERVAGQHQLLGWGLELEQLAFLSSLGARLDVDEYN